MPDETAPSAPKDDTPRPMPLESGRGEDSTPVLEYAALGGAKRKTGLVTVRTYHSTWEARLASGKLEAEGIPCVVTGENMAATGGLLYVGVTGGIELQVAVGDVPRANELLPRSRGERAVPCPRCGSHETAEVPLSHGVRFLFLILLGIPYLFIDMTWLCRSCQHIWKRSHLAEEELIDEDEDKEESDDADDETEEDDQTHEPDETDEGKQDEPENSTKA